MFKVLIIERIVAAIGFLGLLATTVLVSPVLHAQPVEEAGVQAVESRLLQADSYRTQSGSVKTVTEVYQYFHEALKKSQLYSVYYRPDKGSLVLSKSAAEAGQKVLMVDDNYWLFMPKSRRPIRITPMQKLLGDASVGDISSLSWSESYSATISQMNIPVNGHNAIELLLEAKVKGATYHRIELFLNADDNFPLKANLYLKSGKLAKTADFTSGMQNGLRSVTAMVLKDNIQPNKKTVIEYKSSQAVEIAEKLFNPSFLVRNNLSEL
ncbi:outer membrane lipoprotein-sorting protein [Photobacterium lipolyticum]|uniref:Outer membrane lipoprotein-sorting protein n=1 Tax=Photobacterium lipolyticum TaxID=266810 RepID=A0A2T3MZ51_9GAMM|nr:outer membrane lipoprotein-sorting protein [Photobacterium lipolyticum]PSW05234.1 outer membrane lipoprotein-sorting protein [Photobacterium lipolyticum]